MSVAFLAGLVLFSVAAYDRVSIWRDDGTLFSDIIRFNPMGSAYINRATYYQDHYAGKVYSTDPVKKAEYLRKAIADYEAVLRSPLPAEYQISGALRPGTGELRRRRFPARRFVTSMRRSPSTRRMPGPISSGAARGAS